jgi:hypothetical protein
MPARLTALGYGLSVEEDMDYRGWIYPDSDRTIGDKLRELLV